MEEPEEGEEGQLLPSDGEEVTQVNTAAEEAAMEGEQTSEGASEGEADTDEPEEKEKETDNCEPLVDLSDVAVETMADQEEPESDPAKPQSSESLVDLSDVVAPEEPESTPAKPQSDYRLQFPPGDGGLVPVPEHGLLPLVGPGPPQGELSSAASETVESRSESNSTAISASISSRTGGHFSSQFTKAEPLTAKQQVALWLTRTSTQDIHQEFNVTSLRSLVNPGAQSNAAKYKKSKLPCSSKHGGGKSKEIHRNFSTKSLMERFTSGSGEGPGYSPIRKCETVLALSEVQSEVQSLARERGRASGRQATTCSSHGQPVLHRKRKAGEGGSISSKVSLFKRFSKCGSNASTGTALQTTAPGDLCGSRAGESPHPFPGLRPTNRLRSKSSILQCSRCTSVMSVATSRMTSRATSQMSLLLDRRFSRIHAQDDVLCKICLYDCPASAMIKLDECGCSFCKDCMQQYITFEVMEGAYDISCPDPECPTQGVLTQHQMERLTDKELLDKHRTFRLNTEVSMDAARTWCPSAGCDTICHICAGTKSQGVPVSCPSCDKEFCSLCSATWHPGMSCAENGAAIVKRGGEVADPFAWPDTYDDNIKRCPMCSVPIERDAGCAQMMCKRCKHVFCWYCLTSLDDDFLLRHYDSGECQGKLGHSRASVIWHRAQVIGIFAGFGILLLVASPVLLVAAPCIICCKCRKFDMSGGITALAGSGRSR